MKRYASLTGILVLIAVATTLILNGMNLLNTSLLTAIGCGLLLALVFVTSGFVSFRHALKLKQKAFTTIIIISISGRLLLMLLALVLILQFTSISKAPFVASLFGFYFLFQILEVISLNQNSIQK